jgi:ABC-type branched-subunit amino acid transport system permease subunit
MTDILQSAFHDAFSPFALSFVLAAIGINVHFGYTGLLNFGQAAFCAVGAYGMGVSIASFDLPLFPALLVGIIGAGILALILGVPTLRLRADYLAIVTIAAAEGLRLCFSATFKDYFHARDGVSGFTSEFRSYNPFPESMGTVATFSRNDLWVMVVGWGVVVLVCLYLWLLMRSPWGRVLKGIREDEDAMRSLGKNVFAYKLQSLVVGGLIGGLAGIMWSIHLQTTHPNNFMPILTFFFFTIVILGGPGRPSGPSWAPSSSGSCSRARAPSSARPAPSV